VSDELVFQMGKFPARFPRDRQYAKNHMWAKATQSGYRFGLSAYAVRLLQDVYFLDWTVDSGTQLRAGQEIGCIESEKAESDLFAPIEGKLIAICAAADAEPLLAVMRRHAKGRDAAVIGEVVADPHQFVQMETAFGGSRIVDWLAGEQLPRIC